MSSCNIDHSIEDVKKKFEAQSEFLPVVVKETFDEFFTNEHSQETLNEVFHLLKKYDLSSEEERDSRNEKLLLVLKP
jgi:SUMO ligase MMS21 Smc5/6 complex component